MSVQSEALSGQVEVQCAGLEVSEQVSSGCESVTVYVPCVVCFLSAHD